LQKETNNKPHTITYKVLILNDRNLQTKRIKKHVNPSSPSLNKL